MAIFVEGVRGSGKTKIAVREIQIYLKMNRRVVTNLDLDLFKLFPNSKSVVTRIPDQPRSADLDLLGKAYPELNPDDPSTYDEKKFGLIVIDELLTSFNSRNWNDPDRIAVVSWMVQSRKLGWRLMLLCQDVDAVDKQLRETLLQEIWHCRSGKNFFSSPIAGKLFGLFTNPLMRFFAPFGFHYLAVYTGKKKDKSHLASSEFYKLYDLHPCYKTSQNFLPDLLINKAGKTVDMRSSYTALPSNYFSKPVSQPASSPAAASTTKTPSKSFLSDWRVWALSVFVAAYFFSSNSETETTASNSPGTEISPGKNSDPNSSTSSPGEASAEIPKTAFESSVDGLVLTCSVLYANGAAEFCFENKDGAFYPENIGYTISYISPCTVRLAFGDESTFIRCRPNYVHSEAAPAALASIPPVQDDKT